MATQTTIRDTLASNIRRAVHERDMSLNALSDAAGVSRSQLYDVLAGRKGATVDWIERLADALNLHPWQLISEQRGRKRNGAIRARATRRERAPKGRRRVGGSMRA